MSEIRMEKVREALNRGGYVGVIRPALAEVEEWEARVAYCLSASGWEAINARVEAAEAEVVALKESLTQYDRGWKAAEAERDRLREALGKIRDVPMPTTTYGTPPQIIARDVLAAPEHHPVKVKSQ